MSGFFQLYVKHGLLFVYSIRYCFIQDMGKEHIDHRGKITPQLDILTGPVNQIVKTEEGRYGARQMSAVAFASTQIAHGVSTEYALKTTKHILSLTGRNRIATALTSARELIK